MRVVLIILGIILLLPGACGLYGLATLAFDHIARGSLKLDDYEQIGWFMAQPSVMAGCLGLFLLARVSGNRDVYRLTKLAGVFALVVTIGAAIFVSLAIYLKRGTLNGDVFAFVACFGIAFLLGGLPALLIRRPETEEGPETAS